MSLRDKLPPEFPKGITPIRNEAVRIFGEHSRPGCGSARPRAEPERADTHPIVKLYGPPG